MTKTPLGARSGGAEEPVTRAATGRAHEPVADPHPTPTDGAFDGPSRVNTRVEYALFDATGTPIAVHVRRETPDGKKLSWRLPDGTVGLGGIKAADLPLYGVHRLGPDATVVIVEGEKATEALLDAGVQAVGTVTGASSTPSALPLAELTGRAVVLWPDNDDVGRKHMERIAAGLAGIASSILRITWLGAPDGGDAADYLAGGRTAADVGVLIDEAVDVRTCLLGAAPSPSGDLDESEPESRKSQASVLIDLASVVDLFHSPDTTVYAHIPVDGHREIWALESSTFGIWLKRAYWQKTGRAASAQAIQDALGVLAARGQFEGPEQAVDVRLARRGDAIYLDLGDPEWRAVEVTRAGWSVVANPPVRFRRPKGLLALPEPAHGGSLEAFRDLVNLSDENQWRLVIAWLVASLRPEGPYPVLVLGGEQGCAKSTTARFLRAIVDPNVSPDRAAPRSERDLAIAANNGWIVSLDNLSVLSDWLSDALARLATGAGFATRTLYENDDETLFYASRPILLNGIGELAVRSDLLDRALLVDLPRLSDERRRTETEVRKTFEAARPTVLGALLDAVAVAMGRVLTVKLASLPRMADFATWSVAAEPGLGWPSGSFLAAYGGNRRAARTAALDASVIVPAIRALVRHGAWQGTASDLLAALRSEAGEDATQHQGWPLSPRALTAELTRLAPGLRADGIIWERPGRTHGGARVHMLRAVPEETVTSVTSVTTVTTVTADDEVGTAEHETRAGEGDGLGESSAGRVTVAAGRVTVLERGDGWDGLVASLPIGEPAPLTPPPIDQHALASAWDSEPRGEVSPSRERVPACRRVGLGARVMAPVVARVCSTCGEPLDPRSRADRRTCSTRCRVAAWRARGRAGASKPRAVVQQTIPTPGDGATGLAPVTSAPGAVAA